MKEELLRQIYDDVDEIVIYKNSSLEILYCNKFTLQFIGYNNLQDVIGKTDDDLPWAKYAYLYSVHEKRHLEGKGSPVIWPICDMHQKIYSTLCQRIVITDGVEKFILTFSHILKDARGLELSNLGLYREEPGKNLDSVKVISSPLTKREGECLFYLLRCKGTKSIGATLGISHRTVETHIIALRKKFNCSYKSDLTEQAIAMGFLFYIPESLVDKFINLN